MEDVQVSDMAVDPGSGSGSGSLVEDLDHASPSKMLYHASKRQRNEEEEEGHQDQPLAGADDDDDDETDEPTTKRSKAGSYGETNETADTETQKGAGEEEDDENVKATKVLPEHEADNPTSHPQLATGIMSPVLTRRRATAKAKAVSKQTEPVDTALSTPSEAEIMNGTGDSSGETRINERWRAHQMTEDYVNFVGKIMYPGTKLRPYGFDPDKRAYPLEGISALGFLKSPLRRPTVIERWSPYEIAMFEAALFHYGKEFRTVSKEIGTKSTKDVIDFYYTWKKTEHYKKWKDQYCSDADLLDIGDSTVKGAKP